MMVLLHRHTAFSTFLKNAQIKDALFFTATYNYASKWGQKGFKPRRLILLGSHPAASPSNAPTANFAFKGFCVRTYIVIVTPRSNLDV
jgi:hypothetical protein